MTSESTIDPALLDGSAEDVPEVSTKIVRVFLSSTFSDMAEERNILMQDVYPKIQEYCKTKYGINFQMVDMRWGVTNEVQNDHMTSICCLNEIRNCQKVSIGPDFVMLMGQKYGYRPIPAFIEVNEFEILRKCLEEEEKDADLTVLDLWYIKDTNAVPPQYVLQPIDSILKNYDSLDDDLKKASRAEWQDTFEEIRDLLMTGSEYAFDKGLIGGQSKEKYFKSVTHEEIDVGFLQDQDNPNMKCLCFIRTIDDLYEHIDNHRAPKFVDLLPSENGNPAGIDTEAQDRLADLRDKDIPDKLNEENLVRLNTTWSSKGGINSTHNADYLSRLCEMFYKKMTWLIDQNLAEKEINENEIEREIRQSLMFRNNWSKLFFGRMDILGSVERYLTDPNKTNAFVVYGESGTGKTALIAKCAKETLAWMQSPKPVIIVRFLGSSPASSHILLLLKSVCHQICENYGYEHKRMPNDFKKLVANFQSLLEKASEEERPLVIFLDSIDQLSGSFEPFTFQWLPKYLPPNVKVVMSFVPSVFNLLKRFNSFASNSKHFSRPIPPLGNILCMDIIKRRLNDSDRSINQRQHEIVQEVFLNCSLPLYSRVMLDEVLTWKSYTTVASNMVSATLKEALNHFFKRLEIHHGRLLVRHALSYITAAREGVSEMEILDLMSLDDEVLNSIFLFWLPPVRRLPPFLWTRLRIDLDQFLVERDAGDIAVFTWYHRLFKEAATERYLVDDESRIKIHTNMAEYFMGTWSGKEKPFQFSEFLKQRLALLTDKGQENRWVLSQPLVYPRSRGAGLFNKRKLTELPFHLVRSAKYEDFKDLCVFSYNWMWIKITAYGLQILLEDLELFLQIETDPEVQALTDSLRIAGSPLNDHPENLALEITGRLLDYMDSMPKIKELIKDCDLKAANHTSVVVPFQLYEAPVSSLTRSIDNMPSDVGDTIILKHDTRIIAMCVDGTVQNLDLNGSVVHEVSLPKMKSISIQDIGLYVSRDEKHVICESRPASKYVYVLDSETLQIKHEFKMSSANLNHNLFVSTNYICVDNGVYHLTSGKKVHDFTKYKKNLNSFVEIAISMDEKYIMIGGQASVEIFNIITGKRAKELKIPHSASAIELTKDGRLAVIGTTIDCVIKLFDVSELSRTFGSEIVTYDPEKSFPEIMMSEDHYATKEVSEICISHKQGAFVSLVKRKYPIIWSLKNVSSQPRLLRIPKGSGPFRYLFKVQFSSDDKYVLAAELSPNVMMWDAITGDLLASFAAHENDMHDLVVGNSDTMAVTVQQNGPIIKIWDLQKVINMEKMSSVKDQDLAVKNVSFLNESNLVYLSRVHPPRASKAYHYIDFFGIEVLNFATGKTQTVLPYDKYGPVQSITNARDSSTLVINTGNTLSSTISVIDLKKKSFMKSLDTAVCAEVKLSYDGKYVCLLLCGNTIEAKLYTVPEFTECGSYPDCGEAMFTKNGAFVGVVGKQLVVRESLDDDETLTIDLPGEIVAIHYSEAIDVVLVSVDDGFQLNVMAFRAEGFGVQGTISDVDSHGLSDVADDGSICIDNDLKIFELNRCKQIKRLMPNRPKSSISSVRLSSKGQHALFIDSAPDPCIKVCRVHDSNMLAQCFLHCVPDVLEVVPHLNIIVVIGKDSKKLFVLSLCDSERRFEYETSVGRLQEILGANSKDGDKTKFELSEETIEQMKAIAKAQQVKHISLAERQSSFVHSDGMRQGNSKSNTSSSCTIL